MRSRSRSGASSGRFTVLSRPDKGKLTQKDGVATGVAVGALLEAEEMSNTGPPM